ASPQRQAPTGAQLHGEEMPSDNLREERSHHKPIDLQVGPLPAPWPLIPEGDHTAVSVVARVLSVFKRRSLELVFELHGGRLGSPSYGRSHEQGDGQFTHGARQASKASRSGPGSGFSASRCRRARSLPKGETRMSQQVRCEKYGSHGQGSLRKFADSEHW